MLRERKGRLKLFRNVAAGWQAEPQNRPWLTWITLLLSESGCSARNTTSPPHTHTTHCHYSAGAAGGLETIINFQLSFDLHLALSLEMPFITCQKCKLKTFLLLTDLCFCSLLFYFSNESVCMFPIIGNKELTRVFTHKLAHLSGPHLATDFFFFFQIIMCVSTDACGAQRAHWRQSRHLFRDSISSLSLHTPGSLAHELCGLPTSFLRA